MTRNGTTIGQGIVQQVGQLSKDMGLLNTFTHGDENSTVELGGVETRTIKNLVAHLIDVAENIGMGNLPTASPEVKGLVNSGGNNGELFGTVGNQYKMIPRVELLASAMLAGLVPAFSGNNLKLIVNEHGKMEWVKEASKYELGEFYFWRHPTLKPGFQPATGGILENAATLYPEAWAYLQSEEGQLLCTTEEEWQAMTHAIWHTNADGTEVGWNGIGGAPFYALDVVQETIRLPDLRGMYAEAAGFDSFNVGEGHGDGMRRIYGAFATYIYASACEGVFTGEIIQQGYESGSYRSGDAGYFRLDSARFGPTASQNQPRAWGALACVYLGTPMQV